MQIFSAFVLTDSASVFTNCQNDTVAYNYIKYLLVAKKNLVLTYHNLLNTLNHQSLFLNKEFYDILGFIIVTIFLVLKIYDEFSKSSCLLNLFFRIVQKWIFKYNYKLNDVIIKPSLECTSSHHCSVIKEYAVTEVSGSLGSSNQSLAKSENTGKFDHEVPNYIINNSRVEASPNQQYEIKFDQYAPYSVEETRKNVRPVPKEDVGSILESYQKAQITPTTVGYTAPPVVQTKTKPPPAKTVPSSSGSKSHKSLPRRSCLVYLKEQYHLDVDLLAQPRTTKYLVRVRTEISPERYMAKLELHCSR